MTAPKKFGCFVTGTDTEIGKTLITGALLHALVRTGVRAAGMKPVAAGAERRDGQWHNEDADALAQAGNISAPRELTTPYLWKAAIAPHIAARQEGQAMSLDHILSCHRQLRQNADAVVVEGVGGFRVPLADGFDTADLATALQLPVVLVVGLRLGCINHALLTAEAILVRGLHIAAWVANTVDAEMPFRADNIETLRQLLPAPLLGEVPRLVQPTAGNAAGYLDFSGLPDWPAARS